MSKSDNKASAEAQAPKTCFVIGPIGAEGSDIRRKADFLLKGIIQPATAECGFDIRVTRADQIADPGLITEQIIEALLDSDLVIADLSDHNPNAFYELAVRHSTDKATVHMFPAGLSIPFDIKDYRAVPFDITDIDKLNTAKSSLLEAIKVALSPNFKASSPISRALSAKKLRASADPVELVIATQGAALEAANARLDRLERLDQERTNKASLASFFDRRADSLLRPDSEANVHSARALSEKARREALTPAELNALLEKIAGIKSSK